jgi:hypothetical protein
MPLDGFIEGGPSVGASRPYIDNSLTIGAFVYAGNAVIGPDTASQEDTFTEVGADVNAFYDRFNLFGGFGVRHDNQPFVGTLATSANTTTWFAEVDVTVFPWLLPGIRFESWKGHSFDDATGQVVSYSDNQIVPGIVALIRANVKATLRASFAKQESLGDTKFQPGQVMLALSVGI